MFSDRKASFKVPPTAALKGSQDSRRSKALEEQKRRRAEKLDSARHLDLLSDLNLGSSDDEDESPKIAREGISSFASMMQPYTEKASKEQSTSGSHRKRTSRWADKAMYAELLEMSADKAWESSPPGNDGLPDDLETAWVAVGPVPVGKRCLAVTHRYSGQDGLVSNTTLRSRVLGKSLMPSFPTALPPLTVLDCILDSNWKNNGILHVLDVLQWKEQDIGNNEVPFRLWWRDARLSELSRLPQPSSTTQSDVYQFPYPASLIGVPWHSGFTLHSLSSEIIPSAKSERTVTINLPSNIPNTNDEDASMDLDVPERQLQTVPVALRSDGLLLYVSEASYEHGTSPLSTWVPLQNCNDAEAPSPLDIFQRLLEKRKTGLPVNDIEM